MSKLDTLFELVKCGRCQVGHFKMHIRENEDRFEIKCSKCALKVASKKIIHSKVAPKEAPPQEPEKENKAPKGIEGISFKGEPLIRLIIY